MSADTDTTAHRYFRAAEIAEVAQGLDRAFARMLRQVLPREWPQLTQASQLGWVSMVEEYRRGVTPKELYESRSGEPWSALERDEQIRLELVSLLVTGMASVQR